MKNQMIKVAAAGISLRVGDIQYNTEQVLTVLRSETTAG